MKIVCNSFNQLSEIVKKINESTGLVCDRIKPSEGEFVAFMSNGDRGRGRDGATRP